MQRRGTLSLVKPAMADLCAGLISRQCFVFGEQAVYDGRVQDVKTSTVQ